MTVQDMNHEAQSSEDTHRVDDMLEIGVLPAFLLPHHNSKDRILLSAALDSK